MKRRRQYFFVFLILWAGLIFYFSHRPAYQSDLDAKVFIETFAEAQKEINNMESGVKLHFSPIYIVRKTAHVILYGVLTYLSFNVFYKEEKNLWRPFLCGFVFSLLYAISDEIHQLFIPGRTGLLADVGIDSYGILAGGLITALCYNFISISRRRWWVKRTLEIAGALFLLPGVGVLNLMGLKRIKVRSLCWLIRGQKSFIGPDGIITYMYDAPYALYEDFELLIKRIINKVPIFEIS
ncbi:MAG: VanZ family protein [Tissierellales bacterium]|nr:VanZ family protein [Tissierellales bacterium]